MGEGIRSAHFAFHSGCEIELIGLKTVKPEFSDSLDELVDVTQQRINHSLETFLGYQPVAMRGTVTQDQGFNRVRSISIDL